MNRHRDAANEQLELAGFRPQRPGTRSLRETDAVRLVALLPLAGAVTMSSGWTGALVTYLHVAVAILAVQAVFARLRGRRMDTGGLATAAAFVLLLPQDTPLLHVMLGAILGVALGELVFGGRGWSFLNPAVVGLVFVYFSSPSAAVAEYPIAPWAAATGGVVLLALGLGDWRVTLGALVALATAAAAGGQPPQSVLWNGGVIFAVFFLAADPAVVPASRAGRWLYGALVALLANSLATAGGAPEVRALVYALMLGGVFGPLLDSATLALGDAAARVRRT